MTKKLILSFSIALAVFSFRLAGSPNEHQVLVIKNTESRSSVKSNEFLIPYLNHFGIPFDEIDIHSARIPENPGTYQLVILSHPNLANQDDEKKEILNRSINLALEAGAGILNFDPGLINGIDVSDSVSTDTLCYLNNSHYITSLHQRGEKLKLFSGMKLPSYKNTSGEILMSTQGKPFIWTLTSGKGRMVNWASMDWMDTFILGPLGGLDDCLWRSMVWCARKPFVMRGLPPMVTMRVDDVAGRGEMWQKSPLYWVNICNKYQLKPWLGLFIFNLNPMAVEEVRGYILSGQATASPHALGRIPRNASPNAASDSYSNNRREYQNIPFFYNPKYLPAQPTGMDEFIYFNHYQFKPWSDQEAKRRLGLVDQWYSENQPLPKSNYFVAHFYESGANIIEHVSKKWNMEFIAQNKAIDMPWHDSVRWVKQGPFRLFEKPGTHTNNASRQLRGTNPVYYADFSVINGCKFFNCMTEIRDNAGYEWAPDNDVEATVDRGIKQLSRAFNSMALSVLFTHETDFIYKIKPENWEKEIQMITDGIKSYQPVYLTIDEALKIVRATKTSAINKISASEPTNKIQIELTGKTDVNSYLYVFSEKGEKINQKLVLVPAFNLLTEITVN